MFTGLICSSKAPRRSTWKVTLITLPSLQKMRRKQVCYAAAKLTLRIKPYHRRWIRPWIELRTSSLIVRRWHWRRRMAFVRVTLKFVGLQQQMPLTARRHPCKSTLWALQTTISMEFMAVTAYHSNQLKYPALQGNPPQWRAILWREATLWKTSGPVWLSIVSCPHVPLLRESLLRVNL